MYTTLTIVKESLLWTFLFHLNEIIIGEKSLVGLIDIVAK